ncbi:MAG: 3-dehydroquinate synthase [Cyclobacteriaceae bacterium]|nr:3-dehydroquinate synthase [Cyclobacteriaceae bacterium]
MMLSAIHISDSPGQALNVFLMEKNYSSIVFLTDENTKELCYPLISKHIPKHQVISIKSGEENKTIETCSEIWAAMTHQALDRHSVMVILGGGVLGDMGGFCAYTFKRGIDFILVPTTLLAMADASIGGKLGVDFEGFKNHIGVFQEPELNLIHSGFLATLPPTELRSGFAEIIKHALISDREMWNALKVRNLTDQPWDKLLKHSVEFKSSVVAQDPKEKGLRKILNVGHTVGHALETYFLGKDAKILHGEAIAAGLICEAYLSADQNLLPESELKEITSYILQIFGKLEILETETKTIAGLTVQDKKNKGNRILAALIDGIGQARVDCEVTLDKIVDSLSFYRSLQI